MPLAAVPLPVVTGSGKPVAGRNRAARALPASADSLWIPVSAVIVNVTPLAGRTDAGAGTTFCRLGTTGLIATAQTTPTPAAARASAATSRAGRSTASSSENSL